MASSPLKFILLLVASASANRAAAEFGLQITKTSPAAIVPVKGIETGVVPPLEYRLIT